MAQPPMRFDQHRLFAGVGRGGGDGGAIADRSLERLQLVRIGGRLRDVELEVAGRGDARRAEVAVARRVRRRLRQAEVEATQQRADRAGCKFPTIEGALRQFGVHQDQRNPARGRGHDQVRPEIGFREQRHVGLPVIEEARDECGSIERHELMDDALGHPLRRHRRRSDGAGRDQDAEALGDKAFHQRGDGVQFAHARGMQPDQRPFRPRDRALAFTFVQPLRDFLATLEPMRHEQRQ